MAIKNYTTRISEDCTVSEIQKNLANHGAKAIQVDYENKQPQAVRFVIEVEGRPVPFRLPCNFEGVRKAMAAADNSTSRSHAREPERVRMTAWRIVKDWVEAQMAIIESNQAAMAEVFLPYVEQSNGQTLYLYWKESMVPTDRQLKQ